MNVITVDCRKCSRWVVGGHRALLKQKPLARRTSRRYARRMVKMMCINPEFDGVFLKKPLLTGWDVSL